MGTFIVLFVAGIFGSLLLGMIGVGMALVAVPVLTFALPHLGVPEALAPTVALATSMGIVTIGSISSVTAHNKLGTFGVKLACCARGCQSRIWRPCIVK